MLRIIGIIVLAVFVGGLAGYIVKLCGGDEFAIGLIEGASLTVTVFICNIAYLRKP